jgi:hypothetical protein
MSKIARLIGRHFGLNPLETPLPKSECSAVVFAVKLRKYMYLVDAGGEFIRVLTLI